MQSDDREKIVNRLVRLVHMAQEEGRASTHIKGTALQKMMGRHLMWEELLDNISSQLNVEFKVRYPVEYDGVIVTAIVKEGQ